MRLSIPMPSATSFASAPTLSLILAISLIKEMRAARNALDAYFTISAV